MNSDSNHYDMIIVGAGIHGAGVAQAAASSGYRVLVLEKQGIASGTSSRSSKLIHGGLRYLEYFQLSLVKECLRERALLLKNAPHLVSLKPFYIPLYRHTSRRPWQIRIGLYLYSLLAQDQAQYRPGKVPRSQWTDLDGLKTENLQSVYRYFDAQTDDALLTRCVMQSARERGAQLQIGAQVEAIELGVDRVEVHYRQQHRVHSVSAALLVNAAGPWVGEILKCVTPAQTGAEFECVQGSHIVVDDVLQRGLYYLEAPQDARAVFVMPWQGKLMVGTTEVPYHGNADQVCINDFERDYLRQTLNAYFPDKSQHVIAEFAGLRVLPKSPGPLSKSSRETILLSDQDNKPRLLTIYGGKLTAYRATAEKVMKAIRASLPGARRNEDTRNIHLPQCD